MWYTMMDDTPFDSKQRLTDTDTDAREWANSELKDLTNTLDELAAVTNYATKTDINGQESATVSACVGLDATADAVEMHAYNTAVSLYVETVDEQNDGTVVVTLERTYDTTTDQDYKMTHERSTPTMDVTAQPNDAEAASVRGGADD